MPPISEKTRQIIAQRAHFKCEYCQLHEDDMFVAFEIDHIVAKKHGAGDELENLAYACPHCNQQKGLKSIVRCAILVEKLKKNYKLR